MSISLIVANVLKLLTNNTKVFLFLVSTWLFVVILTSFDINVSQSKSAQLPMNYYMPLKNNDMSRKLQKTSSNKIEIDARFLDKVDSVTFLEEDTFDGIKNGNNMLLSIFQFYFCDNNTE